ncbi:MAG: hypothetical protein K2X39_03260 [Silvanigrellaceae bacterium]|nr:hypothetical protein [Silvanigrellaceae bacterium]
MGIFFFFVLMLIKVSFSFAAELESDILKSEVKVSSSFSSFKNEELPVAVQVVHVDLHNVIINNHLVTIPEEERPSRSLCGMCCCSLFKLPSNVAGIFSPLTPFSSFQSIASTAVSTTTSSRNPPEYGIGIWGVYLIRR